MTKADEMRKLAAQSKNQEVDYYEEALNTAYYK